MVQQLGTSNRFLLDAFKTHSVEAALKDDVIVFPSVPNFSIQSFVFLTSPPEQANKIVQLDVRARLAPGKMVLESLAGWGAGESEALKTAESSFLMNDLHVFLAQFLGVATDQVERKVWEIDGLSREVICGPVTGLGVDPDAEMLWFEELKKQILTLKLAPGLHWLRFYCARHQDKTISLEVLLDNEECVEIQNALSNFAWKISDEFYAVRVFMTISGGPDIADVLRVFCANPDCDQPDLYERLIDGGIDESIADRSLALVPIAFGRVLLQGMNITFSEVATAFHPETGRERRFRLVDDWVFSEASKLAAQSKLYAMSPEEFQAVAFRSAEVQVISQVMEAGSRPEDCTAIQLVMPCLAGFADIETFPAVSDQD
jgi:hypothetical protein